MTEQNQQLQDIRSNYDEQFGFNVDVATVRQTKKGLSPKIVEEISEIKGEPQWMLDFRLRALEIFMKKPMPKWGPDLSAIDFDNITYYLSASDKKAKTWEEVPEQVKKTFDRLGIPEAERKFLAGVEAQFDSEVVYSKVREDLEKLGVVFCSTDQALKDYPELVKKYFATVVPAEDNKFSALNSAFWSGGSFVYVPKGVDVPIPLQAYFRINAKEFGQFERTLIIADEGSKVHYIEGCFTKGTPIKTSFGTKKIEDVKEGDVVLTHTNSYKRAYKTMKRKHTGTLCKIKFNGDSRQEVNITGGHPVLAVKRAKKEAKNTTWEPQWIEAANLEKFDYVAMPIERAVISKDERFFSIPIARGRHPSKMIDFKISTDKDFFRLVGYYMAEGSIIGDHYLSFTFNKNEREYIEDVKALLEKFFGKAPLEYEEYQNGISLVLCSTLAARLFKQEFGKGAKNKSLPKWFMLEAPEKQSEFVKGYWRGDGSFTNQKFKHGTKIAFRINTISELLAEQTRDILLRLNVFASINVWKKKAPRSTSFAVYVGGSYVRDFANIVNYAVNELSEGNLLIKQKLVSYTHITENYAFTHIRNIIKEEVKDLEVYNFSVEEDESYVSHGIIVHNCTASSYSSDSLHAAVVEVIAMEGAHVRYTTLQNWSNNVYNLVTKRAFAHKNAIVEWLDANIGSRITMKFPSVYLLGENAKADMMSIAFAGKGQLQDTGAKAVHLAPNTTSSIVSKSISKDGGRTTYRGLVRVNKGCVNVKSNVRCDALLMDELSASDTVPYMEIEEKKVSIGHEASVGKIGEEQLFYLMSRGLSEQEATALIVRGFFDCFTKQLPLEYAVEFNRLIEMEMEGSVG
ncbi:MAG: Fe-S cluster assembly protein SufB [Candidatus Aenigmarchaeota archaeon]|nr:Fe-S cluster assembly protein SufB [Candidatus Aenigmarchaeota archaeon]